MEKLSFIYHVKKKDVGDTSDQFTEFIKSLNELGELVQQNE